MKIIRIPGIPDVKMRPRSTKNGRMYDPNAQAKEASIQKAAISGDQGVYQGPLFVSFEFVFPRPKSHYGTGKNAAKLKGTAPEYCCNNKDIDNMEKFYADSFNCIAYADDCQIVESTAKKRWAEDGEMPHVTIGITQLV